MKRRDQSALPPLGLSRRDALKRGALIAGGVVWAAPTVQAIGMTVAHADDPSAPPPPPPPPPPKGKVPSHAIFLVDCNGTRYGLKLDGTSFDKIASPQDNSFLQAKGFTWENPTSSILAMFAGAGYPGSDASGELALVLQVPPGCTLVAGSPSAYTFDGGLQNCGDGDKYQAAAVVGATVFFYGACHE